MTQSPNLEKSDVFLEQVMDGEKRGYRAYLAFQPLTSFPPFATQPPQKYYTGGWGDTPENAIDQLVNVVREALRTLNFKPHDDMQA